MLPLSRSISQEKKKLIHKTQLLRVICENSSISEQAARENDYTGCLVNTPIGLDPTSIHVREKDLRGSTLQRIYWQGLSEEEVSFQ